MSKQGQKTISFVLRTGVNENDRETLMVWLKQQKDCLDAHYLSQNPDRSAFRIGHASSDQEGADRLCEAMRQQPMVESADVEVPRRLIN